MLNGIIWRKQLNIKFLEALSVLQSDRQSVDKSE